MLISVLYALVFLLALFVGFRQGYVVGRQEARMLARMFVFSGAWFDVWEKYDKAADVWNSFPLAVRVAVRGLIKEAIDARLGEEERECRRRSCTYSISCQATADLCSRR